MGGIRAPQRPFEVKRLVQTIAEKPIYVLKEVEVLKEVLKEVPCALQGAEIVCLKEKLKEEGRKVLHYSLEKTKTSAALADLQADLNQAKALLLIAEKRVDLRFMAEKDTKVVVKETEKVVLELSKAPNKKMIIIYTLAALASGLGIGVLL